MHIVILGGGGFLGLRLAKKLLEDGGLHQGEISQMTLVDIAFPDDAPKDPILEYLKADFSDEATIKSVLQKQPELIFHLAAIVSGEAEKNLDLGMRVNFHASLQLLELCRALAFHPRIVFASSVAVFGGDVNKVILDETSAKPRSSYGTQKAMVELLINDYSRRGFIDGRSLRLPTITVRPGKANAATSSFVSAIIREPLNKKIATYPVAAETEVWIQSPKRVIQNFIHAATIDEKILGDDRVFNLPGLTTTIQEMIASLERITSPEVSQLIRYEADEFLQSIVLTWPPNFDPQRALAVGFVRDSSAEEIIRSYMEEEGIANEFTK
jgi:nucleoside-diphosphate-sugar epimerase